MAAGANCRICGRDLAPFANSDVCNFCTAQFPAAADSIRTPAPPPGNDADEQARADRATYVMLMSMFWPEAAGHA